MTLIKTTVLTAISTIVKVIAALIINKVISIYAGPSGLAIVGQLHNFTSIVMTFSNGAITQGIVKYTAEYQTIEQKQKIFSTSVVISLVCSVITSLILFAFHQYWSQLILGDTKYSTLFVVFGFTIALFSLNTILMSILNGQKEINKYIAANIISSIFSLLFTSLLVVQLNIVGALYALVLNQSIVFFITLAFVVKCSWFEFEHFRSGVDRDSLFKLSRFSLMAITSAVAVPLSHLIVRNHIGENLSWNDAGYWQGVWYISTTYLMVITTSLGIYYLPRLSEIQKNDELIKEILSGYKIIIPTVTLLALAIYIFRGFVIEVAFTDDFMPMMELFQWQLIGDVIKISSWLLSYLMIAKAMTKPYIYTEILSNISFVIFSILFINHFGLIGITYAYSLNYFLYLLMIVFIINKKLL